MPAAALPLDLARTTYSYLERPNPAIQSLLDKHVLSKSSTPRVLDVGCGCGVNAGALKERAPGAWVVGIEPNEDAAKLASAFCDRIFRGTFQEYAADSPEERFDVVLLSDVLEHIADPVAFLRELATLPCVQDALWIVSVPNFGVWYNRVQTALGQAHYGWSGLWDRTHLRFYTRRSIRDLLDYCGLQVTSDGCTPSLVQSLAPLLRRGFERNVQQGEHLALASSPAFRAYRRFVEPTETLLCSAWPEMLAFQIVCVARRKGGG